MTYLELVISWIESAENDLELIDNGGYESKYGYAPDMHTYENILNKLNRLYDIKINLEETANA